MTVLDGSSEHAHQVALVQWAALMAKGELPDLRWLYAVPNGGQRHPAVAGKLRAEGVKPGVPDLILPVPRGSWVGMALEMKAPTRAKSGIKSCSADQIAWLSGLGRLRHYTAVAFGVVPAQIALCGYLAGGRTEDFLRIARMHGGWKDFGPGVDERDQWVAELWT